MKTLFVLLLISLGTHAQADSQVKIEGFAARQVYESLVRGFESFSGHAFLNDVCYATWSADEIYAARFNSGLTKIWANVHAGSGFVSSEKINGAAFISALQFAGIDFGPKKSIRALDCTRLKSGIGRCANQEAEDQYACTFTLGNAG